ncbi:MAG: FAD-binding protein [Thermus sp.]|uniref:FAD-binding oxidoreductase n=1 Tax=Thermus sp. TaxID=275 RepID=UPI0025F64F56|nr:FAD-linked oxidase C-terminal domain-containing protein [Thermus sp.]MCS6868891.1 FAD-binding protein [Thermus sp.]MCS7217916.1 FAD-binding protein [Thermus sp.]MDW8016463.1 FAD-linked oxidase C-terminal domain-containing protein [Thermus sp.]MDW8357221.1 FAD-linked oxidase C-terminal domain-containing protein [Thermus sp.]
MGVWEKAREELRGLFGGRALLARAEKEVYRYDAILVGPEPLAVVLPQSREEVQALVRLARRHGLPLVPRGAGSGLSGGAVPGEGAVVVAFTRMTRLELDPKAQTAWAEPGVTTARIGEAARPFGLFYPPDPASYRTSTLGGNLGENAGGPLCFKYGVTGDYVLELEWVDAWGEVHRLDRKAYDLPGLLIGAEGTLGLLTGARVRLLPLPPHRATLMAAFPEVGALAEAVSQAIAQGAVPARLEFLDPACVEAVEDYLGMGLPRGQALLLAETDGEDLEAVLEELALLEETARSFGAQVRRARDGAEAEALWQARRAVSPALGRIRPKRVNEDIAVPRSALPQVVREIRALGEAFGLVVVQFGHIGDGNLHPNILFDPRRESEERVWALAHEIARVALRHGGVLSGEHGIGLMKRKFMAEALDPATLEALEAAKKALDPWGVMNPGKLLP